MPEMRTITRLLLVVAVAITGCRADAGTPPEVMEERAEAARNACVAEELLRRANDQIEALEDSYAQAEVAGDAGALLRQTATSALRFAEVYLQHAQLHSTVLAHVDSATNHVERQADSLRHVRAAEAFTMTRPAPRLGRGERSRQLPARLQRDAA